MKRVTWISAVIKKVNPARRIEIRTIETNLVQDAKCVFLDVGCGDGFWSEHFSRGARFVVGIDPYEPDVLRTRNHKWGKTAYCVSTSERLPFQDDVFDAVTSVCVFEHLYDDALAFLEIFRVLKSGGQLLATVDSLESPFVSERHRQWHRKSSYCNQFYSDKTLTEKLRTAGFANVSAHYIMGSRLAVYWEILNERTGPFSLILAPLFYPIIHLSEGHHRDSGYKIFVQAQKP